MNSTTIEYLLAAARYLNFTKVADSLYVSQSSVSKRIAQLEKELNITIFYRVGKRVELTEEGRLLVDCLSSCNTAFQKTLQQIYAKQQHQVSTLRIGFISGWDLSHVIFSALDSFQNRFPNTSVEVTSDNMFSLMNGYLHEKYDIIFSIADAFNAKQEHSITHLGSIPNVLLFSAKNPLAHKNKLCLSDFYDDVLYYQGSFQSIYRKCSGSPIFRKEMKRKEFSSWDSLLMAINTGQGYTICNQLFRDIESPLFRSLPFPYQDEVILVRRRTNLTPAIEFLTREICHHKLQ